MRKNKRLIYGIVGILLVAFGFGLGYLINNKEVKQDNNDNNKIYRYEASLNDNMINYNLLIVDGDNLTGELYSLDGEWLSELKDGKAVIDEKDYMSNKTFIIKVDGKIYEIAQK